MYKPSQISCSNCEGVMDSNQAVCPQCGIPRGSQSKSDGYRMIFAIAASVAIIIFWQWWRGTA